jgi:hypothetical protein
MENIFIHLRTTYRVEHLSGYAPTLSHKYQTRMKETNTLLGASVMKLKQVIYH